MKKISCIVLLLISGITAQAYPNISNHPKPCLETPKATDVPDEEKQALIDLCSGMYIMKVKTDQGELSKKMIKL